MTVLKIFIRSLKVSELRKIIVLQSHTLSGRLICQYPRIHNVLESHPHNYTRTGKGKKKIKFESSGVNCIQSRANLGICFKDYHRKQFLRCWVGRYWLSWVGPGAVPHVTSATSILASAQATRTQSWENCSLWQPSLGVKSNRKARKPKFTLPLTCHCFSSSYLEN